MGDTHLEHKFVMNIYLIYNLNTNVFSMYCL